MKLLRRSIPELPAFAPACVWGGAIHARTHELPDVRRKRDRVIQIGAVAGIYWALVSARIARGLLDPSTELAEDARFRECVAATRVPVLGAISLGLGLMLQALRGVTS